MRFLDLLSLIVDNLARRKGRVALTAVGVIIGTSAVLVLVSLGVGLQRNATSQLYGIGELTQIQVSPSWGEPLPSGEPGLTVPITDQSLADIAALPGVQVVVPRDYVQGETLLKYNRLESWPSILGVGIDDLGALGLEAQQGVLTLEKGTAVVGMQVPMNFYDPYLRPGQEPPDPPDLMGQTLKLTLTKWLWDEKTGEGQAVRKSYQIRVVGVIAETRGEADWTIYTPLEEVTAWNEWFQGRRINRNIEGYMSAVVMADDVSHTLEVAEQITALGYQAYTPQSFVQGINSFYLVLQIMFGGMGAIALLVAAIGIANTMAMAILERTREIGLMKAIGATNRDVLSIFLGEAAGIGFLGGVGGVLVGWSAGQILNVLALVYMANQQSQMGYTTNSFAVYTPAWLPGFVLLFATLIGLASGIYPALRAATLVPVEALKYE